MAIILPKANMPPPPIGPPPNYYTNTGEQQNLF